MLHLTTLGGAVLIGDNGPLGGAAAQRKSLALLGLLAPAGDRGMSRDRVVAYLWPEADAERAGHRLTQLMYALRRDLGVEDLFLGLADLRLNPARVESDVLEFRAALQAGQLERAAALYGGPFLDGFFLSRAPEFDRWVENERAGFAREFTECVEALAADAVTRGDLRKASEWWQRLADHDPLSSRVIVHLMSALAAAGNRAGALERARSYQELVERELEAAPNPAVLALAEQLRRNPATAGLATSPAARATTSVAVLPFTNLSAVERNDFFVEGLVEEVTGALARLDRVRVVARRSAAVIGKADLDARELGRRLKVDALLEGNVRQAEDRIRLAVELVDVGDGHRLWSERFERRVADIFALQDELATSIARAVEAPLAALRVRSVTRRE